MNERELNRQVARQTGETVREIERRGFSVAHWIPTGTCIAPIDWDLENARRCTPLFPDRQHYRS